jgi:hypothetical protein
LELQDDPVIKAMQLELDSKQPEEQKQPEKPTSGEQKMAEIEFEGLPRPNAIFLKGVDDMSTSDIKNYCGSADLVKVQWIDDTSCNILQNKQESKAN